MARFKSQISLLIITNHLWCLRAFGDEFREGSTKAKVRIQRGLFLLLL